MKKLFAIPAVLGVMLPSAFATVLFSDNFNSYGNGPLITVSGGVWSNHSGTLGEVDVLNGAVVLTENESEDVNALIAGGPYSSGVLYYSMLVNFSALPSFAAGGYFAHFKDSGTGFRARLFVTTTGAASGMYRLGINNGSTPVNVIFPADLSLGSWHQAVVRYDLSNVSTTLWVDPLQESDPSVTATDSVTALQVTAIALRQSRTSSTGMGTLSVDNVLVATSFVEVVPEPSGLLLFGLTGFLIVRGLRRRV